MYCDRCGASATVYWSANEYLCEECYQEALDEENGDFWEETLESV